MFTTRLAVLSALLLIACDNPVTPATRELHVPGYRADADADRIKTNTFFESDLSAENTCNGDLVTLYGKNHEVFTSSRVGDSLFIDIHFNLADAKGYGVPSGARYILNASQRERALDVETGTEFTFIDELLLNSEVVSLGSEPNLILHLTQTLSIIDNELTVVMTRYSLECRG
jgi:hypothetical protein